MLARAAGSERKTHLHATIGEERPAGPAIDEPHLVGDRRGRWWQWIRVLSDQMGVPWADEVGMLETGLQPL